jgi:hypothetical protein
MNDNYPTAAVETYSFVLSVKVGGVVDSTLSVDETKAKLSAELSDFYGEDGYELIEFHPASDEEKAQYAKIIAEEFLQSEELPN